MQNYINPIGDVYGDIITDLPDDQTTPSYNELKLVDTLFTKKKSVFDRILESTKDLLIMGIFFVIFSLPQIDEIIKKIIPITNKSFYILVGIKSVFFMLSYFIIKNLYLVRK